MHFRKSSLGFLTLCLCVLAVESFPTEKVASSINLDSENRIQRNAQYYGEGSGQYGGRGKLQEDRGRLEIDQGRLDIDRGKLEADRGRFEENRGRYEGTRGLYGQFGGGRDRYRYQG